MKQAFTSSTFTWLGRPLGSSREHIGNHVVEWSLATSEASKATFQNFLLAGIGSIVNAPPAKELRLLRHYLNPLAWPLDAKQRLYDAGDLIEWRNTDMRDAVIAEMIEQALLEQVRPIMLAADAQAGFGLFAGSCLASLQSSPPTSFPGYIRLSPVLLTLPEHADQSSIGGEMYRLSERFNQPFNCLQLGVQEAVNPKRAWIEASALGINALTLAACESELLLLYISNFCKQKDQVILSVDLDVLSEPYAPGDHRLTSLGLTLDVLLPAIRWIAGQGKLLGVEFTGLGVQEQQKERRSRLAASITQDLLSHWF